MLRNMWAKFGDVGGVPVTDGRLHGHEVAAIEEALERGDRAGVPCGNTRKRVECVAVLEEIGERMGLGKVDAGTVEANKGCVSGKPSIGYGAVATKVLRLDPSGVARISRGAEDNVVDLILADDAIPGKVGCILRHYSISGPGSAPIVMVPLV